MFWRWSGNVLAEHKCLLCSRVVSARTFKQEHMPFYAPPSAPARERVQAPAVVDDEPPKRDDRSGAVTRAVALRREYKSLPEIAKQLADEGWVSSRTGRPYSDGWVGDALEEAMHSGERSAITAEVLSELGRRSSLPRRGS